MLLPLAGIVNNCVNLVHLFEKGVLRRQRILPVVAEFSQDSNSATTILPLLLPFPLTSGIINVCLDLAGLFRNKDVHQC